MEDWRHSVKLWDLLEWFGYKFWAASDGEQDLLQQEQASFYPGSPERMPVNCHCIKGKCCGDYLLRILSWTCESHPWSMNPSCRALPGTLCHLLSRCPWLTLPWSVAGETKNNVGCLLACLLPYSLCEAKIGLHQLCLLVEDHLISSDSPAPHCLPPIVGTKKKRRKSWGLEFCGSLCLHPGTCVFQISVGRSELTLSGVSQHRGVAHLPSLHSLGDWKGREQRITCQTLPVAPEAFWTNLQVNLMLGRLVISTLEELDREKHCWNTGAETCQMISLGDSCKFFI